MKDVDYKINRLLDIARSNMIIAGGDSSMEDFKNMTLSEFFNICVRNSIEVDFYYNRPRNVSWWAEGE